MKTKYLLYGLVAALLCACGSDDDDDASTAYTFEQAEVPTWRVDLTGNDEAPSWTAPDPAMFESSMFIMVKLQDELAPYSTADDRLTVFIGDECRAVPAEPNRDEDGNVFFVLKIRGNSTDRSVHFMLCYYSAQLHQIFSLSGQESFASELTYGVDEDFVPPLLKGCKKYPVQQQLTVNLPANVPFTPADGDIIAAFVGNDCRGVGRVGQPFTVFRTTSDETLQLRYYSTVQAGFYRLLQTLTMNEDEEQVVTLGF
ncbi:MAG: hypothetical protein IJP82_07705 [Bacteroidaceae bacterium]|nr:hypothetical protein [Bacteroidaceae bacterium]